MSPTPSSNGHVPWAVYVEDRRASTARLERIETRIDDGFSALDRKLDSIASRQQAIELAAARDDGEDVATDAANTALKAQKKDRGERWWDVGRTVLAATLGVIGALATAYFLGGP